MLRRRTAARGRTQSTMPPPSKAGGVMGFVGTKHVLAVLFACFATHVWIQGSSAVDSVDPDISRNVSQIIADKGYPVEEYEVETSDGFVLSVQRVPWGIKRRSDKLPGGGAKKVVFLLHYLLGSSADWVINYPEQSLPYLLADSGYDVWLGNVRGNTYSRHLRYRKDEKEFWDFCFDEMIAYDLPAMLDFVLNETAQQKLFYVGHSQGCLILFGLLAERPEYNDKIELFTAMAPVTTVTYMRSPIRYLAPFVEDAGAVFAMFGEYDFLPSSPLMRLVAGTLCLFEESRSLCENTIFFICGPEGPQLNKTRLPVLVSHTPAGTSVRNMAHYAQLVLSEKFQKFDFGKTRNRVRYGQETPPVYNLSRVMAPVALYWSSGDWLADPKDVSQLRDQLPRLVLDFRVRDPSFTHLDFSVGVGARRLVYEPLMKAMASVRTLLHHFYPES
ncbi:gastric triacylglycerol lipase-like isoform X2 [Dermacentor variabilis]|uniref:gastric triacylglycerol lipase-like isoform X2 n=1 Tax=Dermacentor variabilis TaxID=34621 RepID=UPI003F5C1A3B